MTDQDTTTETEPRATTDTTVVSEPTSISELDSQSEVGLAGYNYAYLDEHTKREVRRSVLKAIAIPGHQVPFASREMPLARGWGTGGIQVSMSLLGPDDTFKVIDQGSDESVNAANIRRLAKATADVETTTDTTGASIIQTRHRIPEEVLTEDQILVLQVPTTDPLRRVDGSDAANRRRHAHKDYSKMWVALYENVVEWDEIQISARYPVMVNERYLMDPSPIPRWDTTKFNDADSLFLLAAGREARIYAVPPHTDVEPLAFEDRSFQVERFDDEQCHRCGSTDTYLTEVTDDDGVTRYACNDASFCEKRVTNPDLTKDHHLDTDDVAWGPKTPDPILTDGEAVVEMDGSDEPAKSDAAQGGEDA
ncbi:alpha-D-ribose 1-methylphosphonate 5-phosphate C-P-lyase PhnJ [Halogeometricum borinquense]|uniref:Alpha-D-ribose 1-methylphosphonate 5-phosphate C-P-lyase PhnJ n=1 Tax=Halogeometricum borinquense TaxID=60847 RepID=A0A6C0UFM2_9EURY|nr:alpha-D-ribose 1-methylphosphonate 5-phosphate C-P-lyase PhnJ [Halogeometricum borinquense]QIB74264.1 alpha-D-ribose 1-methylphosphonate 5-phosphate C-P-lyase PhnJ [Halogeometricum borinquense]